ncbi:hypothetical protein BDZ97DRAFT_902557 [Flammula alnicola]|nr:hypothetical protein BDZ97DRAFT_902557 [Flammula alnicola]
MVPMPSRIQHLKMWRTAEKGSGDGCRCLASTEKGTVNICMLSAIVFGVRLEWICTDMLGTYETNGFPLSLTSWGIVRDVPDGPPTMGPYLLSP